MKCTKRTAVAAVFMLALGVVTSAQGANIDSQSEKILREMTYYAQGLKSFRTEVQANFKLQTGGATTNKVSFVYFIAGERPNRLATIVKSGDGAPIVISDGKQLYALMSAQGKYVLGDAPKSFKELIESAPAQGTSLAHSVFAGTLLAFASYDELVASLESAEYVGEEKVGASKCHHLKLSQKLYDWDLWIDIGKKPLVRKLEPELSKWQKANSSQLAADTTAEVLIAFKSWATDVAVRDKDFKIAPPESAQRVASLIPKEGETVAGPQMLKGTAAPTFNLSMLGGGQMNLADHKGKEIVILDFWATWCGPCIAAMPQVAEVADAYRSRGVVFYAVNQREEADTVTQFLRDKQWNIPVAMDAQSQAARAYRVGGIPQTVIIGRTGNVEVVHVGASPNLKEQLAGELDLILATQPPPTTGKNIPAKKTLPKKN